MNAYRDGLGKQCDCAIPWPKCPHGWHIEGRHPKTGERYGISLNLHAKRHALAPPKTRGEAEARQKVIIDGMANGAPTTTKPAVNDTLTYDAAVTDYIEQAMTPRDDIEEEHVKHVTAYLARYGRTTLPGIGLTKDARLVQVATGEQVEMLYLLTTKGFANSTKHKYRQALQGLLEWSVRKGRLQTNPIPATVKERGKQMPAGEDYKRTRRIDRVEEQNLMEAAREGHLADAAQRLVDLLVVAFDSGGRKGELLALQWRDVLWNDGPEGRLFFAAREKGARKSKTPRWVPMTERMWDVLEARQINPLTGKAWKDTDYVFGDAIGEKLTSIEKAWTVCRFRARNLEAEWTVTNGLSKASQRVLDEVIDLHFHDIRHECALRWHREKRWSLGTISNLLGHADMNTLRVYLGVASHDALAEAETPVAVPIDGKTTVKRRRSQMRLVAGKGA